MPTRESVMTALLALAATATSFATVTRQIVLIPGAPTPSVATPPAQPALLLLEDHEMTARPNHGGPPKRTWFVQLWLWCQIPDGATPGVPDGATLGATLINNLIEAVETALAPDNAQLGVLTLGGLVQRCWIEGATIKISGDADPNGQCFAIIPISILVP
jgi:hypothetical protein